MGVGLVAGNLVQPGYTWWPVPAGMALGVVGCPCGPGSAGCWRSASLAPLVKDSGRVAAQQDLGAGQRPEALAG